MSSFCKCKSYSHFVSINISIYAIFNDQSFNDVLTNDMVSFEQLGPDHERSPLCIAYHFIFTDLSKLVADNFLRLILLFFRENKT